ncbi:hypothetical protein Clacol_009760 [Clathrus columnatus]|uniref:Bestrophin homolog n=1 Tax=Clathrus columnatus TaxID=1419009 RepID=A0AAV5ALD0_9AGAM|nr:hypothetical protein Clacol_009760 [Clathrus columnatus]
MSGLSLSQGRIEASSLMLYRRYNLYAVTTILTMDILQTFPDEVSRLSRTMNVNVIEETTAQTMKIIYCTPWFVILAYTEYLFTIRVILGGGDLWAGPSMEQPSIQLEDVEGKP